ncbi:MAG: BTAD domain-containing putative transcriptional regulator [Anaerovoracaceae bacterium]|jgi:DNA-binding SARP family transcriptional activator|nr:BTAD domain-containing putative transcriptional regulator [Anaerovoracaceae bacterium]
MLSINMLGEINITYKGEKIVDSLSNKTVAMICLLVLNRDKDLSKEKIGYYFWPDSSEEAAKYNVRYNLWTIGKLIPKDAAGETLIISGKDCCSINNKYRFSCDRIILDSYNPKGNSSINDLLRLKGLFKGDFLEGMYLKNCNEFNEMILFERVICQKIQVELLEELASRYEAAEGFEDSLKTLEEMMVIEPYNEAFAYRIMNMYSLIGNRTAAINFYKKFEHFLRNNLGISPDAELQLFYSNLIESPTTSVLEGKGKKADKKQKLEIRALCIPEVDFFCISEIIGQVLEKGNKAYMLKLDRQTIYDLGYIYNDLINEYDGNDFNDSKTIVPVPFVRIINGFYKFINHSTEVYDIDCYIENADKIDDISLEILNYIKSKEIINFHISGM